ncbi:tRNA dihydrouridine synthase [Tilletia horrida]|nr:tRNA dihydrouridine synthase [Tilletia horrida]
MSRVQVESVPPQDLLLAYDVNICAPMVRYSKRAMRATCARYDTQWTTTPMIVAKEFSRSQIAREADFSTCAAERGLYEPLCDRKAATNGDEDDQGSVDAVRRKKRGLVGTRTQWTRPMRRVRDSDATDESADWSSAGPSRLVRGTLIGQLAASESQPLADGAEILAPHVDGLELNCGCPTSSAWADHIGAYLLRQPERVADMVRTLKDRLGWSYPVCVKIRLDPDLKRTDTLVRNAVEAGASVLTVHGRTRHQSSAGNPVDLEGIAFAIDVARRTGNRTGCGATSALHGRIHQPDDTEDAASGEVAVSGLSDGGGGSGGPIPCVANGDVFTLEEAHEWRRRTGAQGVMSARGLLANPALFAGFESTPSEAVQFFCKEALRGGGLPFQHFHRHVAYMLESSFTRTDSVYFNSLYSTAAVMDWLRDEGWWKG